MTLQEIDFRPRKQPLQQRSTVTVEAILEATVRILDSPAGAQLTTKQVAELAGVSIGSLYQYFPNKQALVSELVRRRLARLVAVVRAACDEAPDEPAAAITYVIAAIIREKQQNRRWWRVLQLIREMVDVEPLVRTHTTEIHAAINCMAEARLRRPLGEAEQARLIIAIDAVEGALSRMVKSTPDRLQHDGIGETFTRMFLAALDLGEGVV